LADRPPGRHHPRRHPLHASDRRGRSALRPITRRAPRQRRRARTSRARRGRRRERIHLPHLHPDRDRRTRARLAEQGRLHRRRRPAARRRDLRDLPGRMNAIRKEDMMAPIVSRGFRGRRAADVDLARIPPGQYVTADFPVLSAGPTPHTALESWDFSIVGELDEPRGWTWEEFRALPSEEITRDIHCVTKWSKLDTVWRGVSVD